MHNAETQSNNGNSLMALVATVALGYFSTRYRMLRPMRRGLPLLLLMSAWFMHRSRESNVSEERGVD